MKTIHQSPLVDNADEPFLNGRNTKSLKRYFLTRRTQRRKLIKRAKRGANYMGCLKFNHVDVPASPAHP